MNIQTLLTRRSSHIKTLKSPAPTSDELNLILTAAARVPDHGKLNPWWFIVFEGDKRQSFGEVLAQAWQKRDPNATPEKLADEQARLMHAPMVIAVISSIRESTIPVWEQHLSAGAACQNLCLAANALGYGTNWLTGWYSFDENVRQALKLAPHDTIAGFIHIGTPTAVQDERPRAAISEIVNHDWQNTPNRGQTYNKDGLGYDRRGPIT